MRSAVTDLLVMVCLILAAVGVVATVSLHPSSRHSDQYSPLAPQHHHEIHQLAPTSFKDQNPDPSFEDQPNGPSGVPDTTVLDHGSPHHPSEPGDPFVAWKQDPFAERARHARHRNSHTFKSDLTDEKNGYDERSTEVASREIPPAALDDFVADDTFQDQGPGSVEIYKLDLFKDKTLLNSTPTTKSPVKNKSKAPKKTSRHSWKTKVTEAKPTSPKTHRKQSNFFDEVQTEVPTANTEVFFGVGGVPELQVGCEGLEASSHKLKRSIDAEEREKSSKPTGDLNLHVTPVLLDLDYDSLEEDEEEERDELFKLKKLESTTKKQRQSRGDMEATLGSAGYRSIEGQDKLPVRGDLGKASQNRSIAGPTRDEHSGNSNSFRLTKRDASSDESGPPGGINTRKRRLLWQKEGDSSKAKRAIIWGFGENEGVVSSDELQTENERRRKAYERRRQEEERRRWELERNRTASEIDRIRNEYEEQMRKREREEEERRRRTQNHETPVDRWEEERRRQEQHRREEEHRRRTNPRTREEEERRRHQEETRRRMEEQRVQEEMRRREEEERRRIHEHRRQMETQRGTDDRKSLEDRRRQWWMKRRQEEEERRNHMRHEPAPMVRNEEEMEEKMRDYVRRNQPINVGKHRDNAEEMLREKMRREREEEYRRRAEEHRRRLEEENRRREYEYRRNQPGRNESSNFLQQRRPVEATRQYRDPYASDARHPSASSFTDRRNSYSETRRVEDTRNLEAERRRMEEEERRKEARRREEEYRRMLSRRYEEERKRIEAARLEEERRNEMMEQQRRRLSSERRPQVYDEERRIQEQRRRPVASIVPANMTPGEVDRERQRQEESRRRYEAEREARYNERQRQEAERLREERERENRMRGVKVHTRGREEERLNSLPVSARIIVRSTGTPDSLPPRATSRFGNEIDFPGINPNREGVQASRFPAAATSRPPARSPGPCVWAVVQCCPSSRNRVVTCFESLGCPGVNWDPNPCRSSVAQAAREEVMKFYAAAEETPF